MNPRASAGKPVRLIEKTKHVRCYRCSKKKKKERWQLQEHDRAADLPITGENKPRKIVAPNVSW